MAAMMAQPLPRQMGARFETSTKTTTRSTKSTVVPVRAGESRIGKHPVQVPKGVTYTLKENFLSVKGPKGALEFQFPETMVMEELEDSIKISKVDQSKKAREGHGLYRTLANNMFVGVSTGFEKKLKLVGVGYKASMQGKALNLALGFAHPVILDVPAGLECKVDSPTEITVSGFDKAEVGNFAAIIRSKRKPEPYKGKGVRYADEYVAIKEGKRK